MSDRMFDYLAQIHNSKTTSNREDLIERQGDVQKRIDKKTGKLSSLILNSNEKNEAKKLKLMRELEKLEEQSKRISDELFSIQKKCEVESGGLLNSESKLLFTAQVIKEFSEIQQNLVRNCTFRQNPRFGPKVKEEEHEVIVLDSDPEIKEEVKDEVKDENKDEIKDEVKVIKRKKIKRIDRSAFIQIEDRYKVETPQIETQPIEKPVEKEKSCKNLEKKKKSSKSKNEVSKSAPKKKTRISSKILDFEGSTDIESEFETFMKINSISDKDSIFYRDKKIKWELFMEFDKNPYELEEDNRKRKMKKFFICRNLVLCNCSYKTCDKRKYFAHFDFTFKCKKCSDIYIYFDHFTMHKATCGKVYKRKS